ncbi:MAG: 4-hydroxy-3-methylbut-2-enyl diphosphate reductase [Lachnospiraceae bacterium]|nr:4-hydroxy-3-methylbut-2-enyl diphosphate reductase [Lachnospiraceae bacterium]
MGFAIAIDGPAGAGKSTIAKAAAARLGAVYVDTGAMYRTIALYLLRTGTDCEDTEALSRALSQIEIRLGYEDGLQQMYLNGENVTGLIRTEEVSRMASISSSKKEVRASLLKLQRDMAKSQDVLMDGRDIGTKILPDAQLKIFLTASADVRAKRRYLEQQEKGVECTLEEIKADIIERDYRDMHREESPLCQAEDAVLVDTSDLTLEESIETIVQLADSRRARRVITAETAGFCFGVRRAVETCYEEAQKGRKPIYTFGPIIHNEQVVSDLEKKGVRVIASEEELSEITEGTVIIRSHGVGRSIYQQIERQGLTLVDATCPFVKKIHKIVKEKSEQGWEILIIGSADHPEVQGICGWISGKVQVIATEEEARAFKTSEDAKICVVSQTTFDSKKFSKIVEIIKNLRYYYTDILNTICNATEERQAEARKLAQNCDAMIVIGGRHSSNTQKLYEICRSECEQTFYIQSLVDFDVSLLPSSGCVGITAGASTPNNLIEEVSHQCLK